MGDAKMLESQDISTYQQRVKMIEEYYFENNSFEFGNEEEVKAKKKKRNRKKKNKTQ